MPGTTIVGSGHYNPGAPVTNEVLARVMDTTPEWIRQRTGIAQRHYAGEGEGASDLGAEAARRALEHAGVRPEDVDYLLFATMTPDYVFPGSGGLLGAKIGIPGVPALDIRQQCAAFPFGLQVADGLLAAGACRTVLFVGAEAHAGFMPWADWDLLAPDAPPRRPAAADWDRATRHRGLAVLFGDGAGAVVLRRDSRAGFGLLDVLLRTDGRDARKIFIEGGGFTRRPYSSPAMFEREEHIPQMDGRYLFKTAATKLPQVVRELCARNRVAVDDVDCFVAHQANERINEAVREALGAPREKFPANIERYGNTSAATIPILLDELLRDGRVARGDLLCFIALGAGLHYGAALLRL